MAVALWGSHNASTTLRVSAKKLHTVVDCHTVVGIPGYLRRYPGVVGAFWGFESALWSMRTRFCRSAAAFCVVATVVAEFEING